MGPRLTRPEKKARTRRDLLAAASEVFAERGFVATSIDQIAERAGMTKGAVYSNFDSKDDLLLAVMDEHLYATVEHLAGRSYPDRPIAAQASEAGRLFTEVFEANRTWFLLAFEFDTYAARNPSFHARYFERYRQVRERFAGLVQQGADGAGVPLPMPADQFALALFAFGNGIALEKLNNPDVPTTLFGDVVGLLYDGMVYRAGKSADAEL